MHIHWRNEGNVGMPSDLDRLVICVIIIETYIFLKRRESNVPPHNDRKRSKADILLEEGALNPTPEKVRDPKFLEDGFFDPRDAIQVKYEMLRRVSVEKVSVTDVSDEYGVSRPTYYQAKANFEEAGIAGLVAKKRGPHGPHKIQSEVLAFLEMQLGPGEPIRARELAKLVQKEFGLDVHPRTIERAVGGKKTAK
jgi:transposase